MARGTWLELVVVAAIFVPLACGVAVYLALGLRRALHVELAAMQAGATSPSAARNRFLLRAARTRRTMVNLSMVVGFAAYLFAGWAPLLLVFIAPELVLRLGLRLIPLLPTGVMMLLALSAVTFFPFDLLSGLLIEPPYARAFGGPTITPARAVRRASFRVLVLYVPMFAALAVVSLAVQQPDALVRFPWLEIALVVVGVGVLFGQRLRAWLVPSRPMEQTDWIMLAPRIREWARLAGVDLGAVRVHAGGWLGIGDGISRGTRHPILSLSERFLASSDWRQQDALTVQLLGMVRERSKRPAAALAWPLVEVTCLVVIVGSGLLVTQGWLVLWLVGLGWAPLVLGGVLVLLPIASFVLLFSLLRHRLFGRTVLRRQTLAADRLAVHLTGDPLALAVALHTLATLSRGPVASFFAELARSGALAHDRFEQLNRLLSQPGAHPWAPGPIPAIAAVQASLPDATVPLDRAPAPTPVPATAASAASSEPDGH